MSEPTNTHDAAPNGDAQGNPGVALSQVFTLALTKFEQALAADDFGMSQHWLDQAGNLTANNEEARKLYRVSSGEI